jgi:hypothetical protein
MLVSGVDYITLQYQSFALCDRIILPQAVSGSFTLSTLESTL